MPHALRSIAFVAELIHQPTRHDPTALQQLHASLFGSANASYRDFRLLAGGAQLANTPAQVPGPVSCANVLADRVQVREEQTGVSREDFQSRTREVAEAALATVPGQAYLAQQYSVRSVMNLHTSADARAFVLHQLLGLDDESLGSFHGEPSLGGLRFTFPPEPETGAIYNVRLESFAQDNRSLFLEVIGTFAKPVNNGNLDDLRTRSDSTYSFLHDRLVSFVSRFDTDGPGL